MKITKEWLNKNNACLEGIEYCEEKGFIGLPAEEFAEKLIDVKKLNWANWLVVRALNKIDRVRYAVYAAKLVLPVYEEKYQGDDRPRKAIDAAESYIDNPCAAARDAVYASHAAYAARDAADAAVAADTADAAFAADAAYAAAHAADAACIADTARVAAHATAHAAHAAYATQAGGEETYIKIIKYGINLLNEEEK